MIPTRAHRLRRYLGAVGLVGVLLGAAGTACGQQAQRLAYCTSEEAEKVIGPTAGQTLEWGWREPAGATFPTFVSDRPMFARWLTLMVPGGTLHLALDRSEAKAPYDLLYVDRNADGHLEDEEVISANVATEGRRPAPVEFRQVPVSLAPPSRGVPVPYHLNLTLTMRGRDPSAIVATAAGWHEGEVIIAGGTASCALFDTNANGAFNDLARDPAFSDLIRLGDPSSAQAVPVTEYIDVNGTLYALMVAEDGSYVKFTPLKEAGMGLIRMPADIIKIRLVGPGGRVTLDVWDGQIGVPAGRYRVEYWQQARQDESGALWTLEATVGETPILVDAVAGQSTELDIGDPVRVQLELKRSGRGRFQFRDPRLVGRSKERVTLSREGRKGSWFMVEIASEGCAYQRTLGFGRGSRRSATRISWEQPSGAPGPFTATLKCEGPFELISGAMRLDTLSRMPPPRLPIPRE